MAHITQPANSQVRLSPFSQRLLQYNIQDSNIYLSRSSNSLLNAYLVGYYGGDPYEEDRFPPTKPYPKAKFKYTSRTDCIIDGLENKFTLYGDYLECVISPGQCIVDQTLLIFPEETKLDVNIHEITYLGDTIRCILSVQYQWLESLYESPPKLRLTLIDPNDPTVYGPDIWETRRDRLVISYFDLNLADTNEYINYNPKPAERYEFEYININNVPYEIGPNIIFLCSFANYVRKNFAKKKIVYTKPCINPEGLKENEITFPIIFFNVDPDAGALDPIIGIRFDINYDPNEIHFPKFAINKQLLNLTKITDFYVDRDSSGNETGLIRIQVGENAYTPTIIPDIELGKLTFYFNNEAPVGTNVKISVTNTSVTYSNATTSNLLFVPRVDPTVETNLQSPALTYNYQQAQINFGNIDLDNNQHILFYMNGVLQIIDVTDDMINHLIAGTQRQYKINSKLQFEMDSTNNNLLLYALDSDILFTNPSIINDLATDKMLTFDDNSGEFSINNANWYWLPMQYDLVSVTFNLTDSRTYLLSDLDIAHLLSNVGVWVTIPSSGDNILQLQYSVVGVKPSLQMRVNPTFASSFTITNLSYTMKNGSSICSQAPSIKDYRRAQHVYDLTGIDLTPDDYILYEDDVYNTESKVVLTEDIINTIKTDKYGYKQGNLHIFINRSDKLTIEPIIYNTNFKFSNFYDLYLDEHEPTTRPCIWFKDSFISTRPVGTIGFVEDRDKVYATCWQQGDLNWQSAGERDFYCTIDISDLNNTNFAMVQVTQDGFVINPESIELLLNAQQIRIWMPEQFVFKDPIPDLIVYIIG